AQSRPASIEAGGVRVVHFPKDRSLGALKVQDSDRVRQIKDFHYWIDNTSWYEQAEYLGEAMGDVTIPAGKRLALFVNKTAWKDLSPLSKLGPDDLYMLRLPGLESEPTRPDNRCMQHIAGLTGLKALNLHWTNIDSKGLRYIKEFKNLERLCLPERITDAGLADVAELQSLKGLYLKRNQATNTGLAHLAKLSSLEELELGGEHISDAGLVHLAKLPKLRYLLLWGNNFSDAGLVHLKNIPSLKILHIGRMLQITDTGMAHLSDCAGLENLNLQGNNNISDEGIVHLKKMQALKKLNLRGTKITDKALAHLAEIKSLEYIDLPSESVTDRGLVYLGQLTNLKHLRMPNPHYVDPKKDKRMYTDKGLKELAKLQSLEELMLGGLGVTDEGMSQIAKLKNLKDLNLFGCPITNEGLAKLTALKSLKHLSLYKTKITIGGLAKLNDLKNLEYLEVRPAIQDYSGLNISGLTKLRTLYVGVPNDSEDVIRDEDLACLANLKNLRWFQISQIITEPLGLTDAGVAHLAGLTNMNRLTFGGPELTDKAFVYLEDMKKLDMLNVYGGNFTDEGLANLKGLKALRSIRLIGTNQFSPGATIRLKKELPNLEIFKTDLRDLGIGGIGN
ncbi:leucine-rich repeat domain-containing protein, partial [Planctomycetota bacterium]